MSSNLISSITFRLEKSKLLYVFYRKKKHRKKKITQVDVAKACSLDQGTISRIMHKDTRELYNEQTVASVFKTARELGYVHPALVTSNRRIAPRRKVNLKASVKFVLSNNDPFNEGLAEIHELSTDGVLLTKFEMKTSTIPLNSFKIMIKIDDINLKGVELICIPARFAHEKENFAIGTKLFELGKDEESKIKGYIKFLDSKKQ